jgi:hypothetical protein
MLHHPFSFPSDVVPDPFVGRDTTAPVAAKLGLIAWASDRDPAVRSSRTTGSPANRSRASSAGTHTQSPAVLRSHAARPNEERT